MKIKIMFGAALLLLASPLLIYAQEATTTEEVAPEIIPEVEPLITGSQSSTSTPEITPQPPMSRLNLDMTESTSTPTIISGHSVALANILNIVNTNFINSSGVILFSNFFDYLRDTLDLRGALAGMSTCGTTPCTSGEEININIANDATIDNTILLNATSGDNTINEAGQATIDTGNAYAGLNLINLANNNFVDSNYLLVTLNAFGGVGGDIVFPNLGTFIGSLASGASSPTAIDLDNTANVTNNVDIDSSSGDNQTENVASSTIATGDSHSSSNVFNQINSNLVGGNNVSILFRVHGNWAGQIFGAPPELGWVQNGDGSIYLFDTATDSTPSTDSGQANITGTNTTLINNDVSVIALTGDNQISNANTALISTGNAYAGANIVNIANSNVIGQNWILAIINIFGDFNGNIAFGRPDLWVGEQVQTPEKIADGNELTYKFTVINNGDSDSSNTTLADNYDANHLEILNSSLPYTTSSDGKLTWDLGRLPAGGATEISYQARIKDAGYNTEIANTVTVAGLENDNNPADNTDTVTVTTDQEPPRRSSHSGNLVQSIVAPSTPSAKRQLEVTRDRLITVLEKGQNQAHQKLVIYNPSAASMNNIVLHDVLKDLSGNIIRDETWDLGTVLAHEEIVLEYKVEFSSNAPRKLYTLNTSFDGFKKDTSPSGYIWLKTGAPEEPENLETMVATEPTDTSTSPPEIISGTIDLGPKLALAAAVGSESKTPLPPLDLSIVLIVMTVGIWAGYEYVKTGSYS